MDSKKVSESAQLVAVSRAAHLNIDGEPKILEDHYANLVISDQYREALKTHLELFQTPQAKIVRSLTLCRSRIAEDLLMEAIERGIRQYVILGAGLDSFAFRHSTDLKKINVFEIDHPASQNWKQEQLKKAGVPIPANLYFVPLDFERHSLKTKMEKSKYDNMSLTFFSWLGVTQFIDEASVFNTLRFVAADSPSGSEILFQYCLPDESLNESEKQQRLWARKKGEQIGEPWKSTFHTERLVKKLEEFGFTHINVIDKNKAQQYLGRYFNHRSDDLELSFGQGGTALMNAVVG